MQAEFDRQSLVRKLKTISAWKKLAFALSICERLYPNFVKFSDETNFTGSETLKGCLNIAWESFENTPIDTNFLLKSNECESVAPDTEDYQTILVSSALDAAISVSYLMRCLDDLDIDLIVNIASLSCESVDMYVQELEDLNPQDINLERKIVEHPLMQQELVRQNSEIEFLYGLSEEMNISLPQIKEKWLDTQISNLGLTI